VTDGVLAVRDLRSVWGPPLEVPLGERVTVLVGANRAGSSNVAWSLAVALDPERRFVPGRDLPRVARDHIDLHPGVEVAWPSTGGGDDTSRHGVTFDRDRGTRACTSTSDLGGMVVFSGVEHTPRDALRHAAAAGALTLDDEPTRARVAAGLLATMQRILPEIEHVGIDRKLHLVATDDRGGRIPVPELRALTALGLAVELAGAGHPPVATVVEAPEVLLHPAAQEAVGALLLHVAQVTAAPVLVTTTSPFVIPRVATTRVVALARDAAGRTQVAGHARGDEPQARVLGGLLRDHGLATVLDRLGQLPPGTRAALIVEGGTDEAYLRQAADTLGRAELLEDVVVLPGGGAMGAASAAIVLRAESAVPLLVLLDHDDAGRRARDTLVSRFDFVRGDEVLTYADVFDGGPLGVEAETLFDLELLRRFVAERGRAASHGERRIHGLDHVRLTSSGKSAFVGWLRTNVAPAHLERWAALLDLLAERLEAVAR
jgi:5S rRNA maturation endonuclease (ribonuclease M5)